MQQEEQEVRPDFLVLDVDRLDAREKALCFLIDLSSKDKADLLLTRINGLDALLDVLDKDGEGSSLLLPETDDNVEIHFTEAVLSTCVSLWGRKGQEEEDSCLYYTEREDTPFLLTKESYLSKRILPGCDASSGVFYLRKGGPSSSVKESDKSPLRRMKVSETALVVSTLEGAYFTAYLPDGTGIQTVSVPVPLEVFVPLLFGADG